MDADVFSKVVLTIAISFCLVGISIQIIRVLDTFNKMLKDVRYFAYEFEALLKSIKNDYLDVKKTVFSVLEPLQEIKVGFLNPLSKVFRKLGAYVDVCCDKI